ncbi:BREX system ATP-binding domain-containing protein [Schaedlerella arabinosiphila]|uniref:BREX system ATP-binding domain-containing protein n=1 Tax=Schaedlerella arabinosiphila TaxID=2044587 RepID=UPI00255829B3|nr:BREX system ATP-binding domain-containing protein [Schaedlerella arabinosiphila]
MNLDFSDKNNTVPFPQSENSQTASALDSARQLTCGIDFLTDFWKEKYLQEYIKNGGSKIKFITGRTGSGKSHFLRLMTAIAQNEHYKTVQFSAKNIWMHDFKELYKEIFLQCGIMECLEGISRHLIREMGYDPDEVSDGMRFIDYLSEHGQADALTRREIRTQLKHIFLENPMLDNNFALACSMLTGSILGYPVLEEQNRNLLLAWLEGDRTIKLSQLRALDFYPSRITKYNARHMLRSLTEIIHLGGYSGLFIAIDDLEILISRSSLEPVHYTKMKREDTYESIRQLIDDIDSMKHIMFVYGFDRELIDNENAGLKSYQALWMRIQNEIVGERFNRFSDMVDLDRLAVQEYTPDVIISISKSLAELQKNVQAAPLNRETAEEVAAQARTGAIGIPQLIQNIMQEVRIDV